MSTLYSPWRRGIRVMPTAKRTSWPPSLDAALPYSGAVLGAAVTSHSHALLPWGLGFAAGAMLFVISHEIIPESHRKGHERFATAGLMIGFVLMMVLDTALG